MSDFSKILVFFNQIRGRVKNPRSAIKGDLFATHSGVPKIDSLGDPLVKMSRVIDFAALATEVDRVAPRIDSAKGGRPHFPTETIVRILALKRPGNISDEQVEFQLLDQPNFQQFCGKTAAPNIPNRSTVWNFENRIGTTRGFGEAGNQGVQEHQRNESGAMASHIALYSIKPDTLPDRRTERSCKRLENLTASFRAKFGHTSRIVKIPLDPIRTRSRIGEIKAQFNMLFGLANRLIAKCRAFELRALVAPHASRTQ
jgi:hypothetical protein